MKPDEIIAKITEAYETCGHLDYGEDISMAEHMLQAAHLAAKDGCSNEIVVAALLHDYGHLVCNLPNDTFYKGKDNYHEDAGAAALNDWFKEEIVSAIELHVQAKRYLCATTTTYFNKLSPASVMTLKVQGGPMNEDEIKEFESKVGYEIALKVRVYDDLGKEKEMSRPELEHYIPMMKACLK